MTDRRFKFGTATSILWLVGATLLLALKWGDALAMTPNAWGDFFAGCFAPLAFLWLVLGYLQQGEELRMSTEALRLQAEELKNSVEQQRALVEVSRLQVEAERAALEAERKSKVDEAKPAIWVESDGGSFSGNGESTYSISISNSGSIASGIHAELRLQLGQIIQVLRAPVFDKGNTHRSQVTVARPELIEGSTLDIHFQDRLGNNFFERYSVFRLGEHPHASLKISRIEA